MTTCNVSVGFVKVLEAIGVKMPGNTKQTLLKESESAFKKADFITIMAGEQGIVAFARGVDLNNINAAFCGQCWNMRKYLHQHIQYLNELMLQLYPTGGELSVTSTIAKYRRLMLKWEADSIHPGTLYIRFTNKGEIDLMNTGSPNISDVAREYVNVWTASLG